jgi:hypothetical protein
LAAQNNDVETLEKLLVIAAEKQHNQKGFKKYISSQRQASIYRA